MVNIDKDVELVAHEVGRLLSRHRKWVKESFKSVRIWELLSAETRALDRILNLAFPVLGVGITERVALIALGSYGRAEVCPHSDLDLLILHQDLPGRRLEDFSSRLLGLLWDQKIQVGHSIRTIKQCLELSEKDYSVFTSLLDARLVAGSAKLFQELKLGFEKTISRHRKSYFYAKLEERRIRQLKFGKEIWLIEPNLMEGTGGLRDWHLIKWFIKACFNLEPELGLEKIGFQEKAEFKKIRWALSRLFRLRFGLHLIAGEKIDQLRIEHQGELAKLLEIKSEKSPSPEDGLLAYFFSGAELIEEILEQVVFELRREFEGERKESVENLGWLFLEQGQLLISEKEFEKALAKEPKTGLELFMVSAQKGLELAPSSRRLIRRQFSRFRRELKKGLMGFFAQDLKTGAVIQLMKKAGILKLILPELELAFSLGPRDQYHIYTVGWHSIRCLERIEEIGREPEFGNDPEINWRILKLAGLLHDLGKGKNEDHQKAGFALARKVARRFRLGRDAELLEFLVQEHMLINYYAQRRDFYEPKAVEYLLQKLREPSRLKMLFILTCADIQAVSDKSWTSWKAELLRTLYHFLLAQMEKRETPSALARKRISEIKNLLKGTTLDPKLMQELEKLPTRYLVGLKPEKLVEHLKMVERRAEGEIIIQIQKLEKPRLELLVICDDYPGLFSELSGVLSAFNYNILSAEINTLKKDTALDLFLIEDLLSARAENWTQEAWLRTERLSQSLREVLERRVLVSELVRKKRGIFKPKSRLEICPEVQADQERSEDYTILEVQAQDQPGLLYKITKTIFEQGLDIHFAKISTRAERVFDVFYLRDSAQKKVPNEKISQLMDTLQKCLKEKKDSPD